MTTQTEVWMLFFATATLAGFLMTGIVWMLWKVMDYGRSWVITLDDTGMAGVRRRRVVGDTVKLKTKGGPGRAFILNGKARYTANRGPLFLVHGQTGQNLMAPTRDEFESALKRQAAADAVGVAEDRPAMTQALVKKLLACDPFYAFNSLSTNSYKKWISTQEGKPDWRAQIAPMALIAVCVMAIVLGFVVYKMNG